MTIGKRSLSKTQGAENAPLNRQNNRVALSDGSSEDAVGLLLHLSRHSPVADKSPHRAMHSLTRRRQPLERAAGASSAGHESASRRVARLVRPIAKRGVSNVPVSDDEDDREQDHSFSPANDRSRHSNKHRKNNIPTRSHNSLPPVSMALSPPPRLPNVECGSTIKPLQYNKSW